MIDHISVIIVTKNEANTIADCLTCLKGFNDIWVVDSVSTDATQTIANTHGARVVNFIWNGQYPKKRQWCLDTLDLRDWVLFIDADERMTPPLYHDILSCSYDHAGYFIKGRYQINEQILQYGLQNNKLCLIHRHKVHFPVVDDLDISDMGEIEGHYQPVMKHHHNETFGQLNAPLIHHINSDDWQDRHERYAKWQAHMNARNAMPHDSRAIKTLWHRLPCKPILSFVHSYILKRGFLDGRIGLQHALMRSRYYAMISNASKNLVHKA